MKLVRDFLYEHMMQIERHVTMDNLIIITATVTEHKCFVL